MSFTYPHYASQSPVASFQSSNGVFHQHMGANVHPQDISEEDEESSIHGRPIHHGHRGRRPSKPSVASPPLSPWSQDNERQPLLGNQKLLASGAETSYSGGSLSDQQDVSTIRGDYSSDDETGKAEETATFSNWPAVKEESLDIIKMTVPVLITQLLEYSLVIASVIAIGHLSTLELAASTLGSMTSSVTGYSVIVGMVSALDTLLPQAWGSVGDGKQLVGLWTQRMVVVIAIILIPILALWQSAESILLFLKQEPEVARLAAVYLKWMCLGLPAYAFNYTARKYYQSQGLLHVPSLIVIVVAPINAVLNYVLVWGPAPFTALRLGYIGAPIATAISFNLISVCSICYACLWAPREAWHPLKDAQSWRRVFSWEALGFLVKLGLAGVGQTASEWWSWELIALAASMLGPTTLAAQSVLLVSASTAYQFSFAISVAASVRTGNLVGAGRATQARLAANISFILTLFVSGFNSVVFLVFRKSWGYLFNNDVEVVQLVARVLPLLALFQLVDGLSAMTGGIMRATGRQYAGALLNLTGYYVIGIPFGLLLTFTLSSQLHLGLLGLWIGLSVALTYTASIGLVLCLRTDWHSEVHKAQLRLKSGEQPIGD